MVLGGRRGSYDWSWGVGRGLTSGPSEEGGGVLMSGARVGGKSYELL